MNVGVSYLDYLYSLLSDLKFKQPMLCTYNERFEILIL